MAKPERTGIDSGQSPLKANAASIRAGRLRPATRRLSDVLEQRGPLTGPVTDAGTRALLAVRGETADDERGEH
jgi:hypothetical protein